MSKKADSKTLKRLLSYISQYRIQFIFVLVSILLSAVASVVSTLFLKTLIDDYITPLLLEAIPDFSGLARLILIMAGIYLIGVIATLFYNRVMVVIAQGVLKEIRDEMVADKEFIRSGLHYIMIIKYLERIADHITNIAEWIYYSLTGEYVIHASINEIEK